MEKWTKFIVPLLLGAGISSSTYASTFCLWDETRWHTDISKSMRSTLSKQKKSTSSEAEKLCLSNIMRESIEDPTGNFEEVYTYYPVDEDPHLIFNHAYTMIQNEEILVPEYMYYPGPVSIRTKQTYNEICQGFDGNDFVVYTANGNQPTYSTYQYIPDEGPLSFDEKNTPKYNDGMQAGVSVEVIKEFLMYRWNDFKRKYLEGHAHQEYGSYMRNHTLLKTIACGKPIQRKKPLDKIPSIPTQQTTETILSSPPMNMEEEEINDLLTQVSSLPIEEQEQIDTIPSRTLDIQGPSTETSDVSSDRQVVNIDHNKDIGSLPFLPEYTDNPLLVVDVSDSITSSQCYSIACLEYIIKSLQIIVDTLEEDQFFNVVFFDETSLYKTLPSMKQANAQNKKTVQDLLQRFLDLEIQKEETIDTYSKIAHRNGMRISGQQYIDQQYEILAFQEREMRPIMERARRDSVPNLHIIVNEHNALIKKLNPITEARNTIHSTILGSIAEDDPQYFEFDNVLSRRGPKTFEQERLPIILDQANTPANIRKHVFAFTDFEFFKNDNDRNLQRIREEGLINEAAKTAEFLNNNRYPLTIKSYGNEFHEANIQRLIQDTLDFTNNQHVPANGVFELGDL